MSKVAPRLIFGRGQRAFTKEIKQDSSTQIGLITCCAKRNFAIYSINLRLMTYRVSNSCTAYTLKVNFPRAKSIFVFVRSL